MTLSTRPAFYLALATTCVTILCGLSVDHWALRAFWLVASVFAAIQVGYYLLELKLEEERRVLVTLMMADNPLTPTLTTGGTCTIAPTRLGHDIIWNNPPEKGHGNSPRTPEPESLRWRRRKYK